MRIGLVQIDGKLPNLALMQICGYHESLGDTVEWFAGELFADDYDLIYASKLFAFSPMPQLPSKTIIGGTGIDFTNKLPSEIASAKPSYSLYPKCDYHLGFSQKGCRLGCKFCCVPQKEGKPFANSSIPELLINPIGGNRLMLLDNDFFGGPDWKSNIEYLIETQIRVCFAQGLNIRNIEDEQAELLAQVRFQSTKFNHRYLTFAWDSYNDKKRIIAGIDRCEKYGIAPIQMQFFVLIGFATTPEQDLERVTYLRDRGCMPYVMPYKRDDPYQAKFARWVNHRAIFKTVEWKDYH